MNPAPDFIAAGVVFEYFSDGKSVGAGGSGAAKERHPDRRPTMDSHRKIL